MQWLKEIWMRIDVWFFMRKVNKNPEVRNAKLPEGSFDELMKRIRAQEENKDTP